MTGGHSRKSRVTTHILDTAAGRPASLVTVRLAARESDGWQEIGSGVTDDDGRIMNLGPSDLAAGEYRIEIEAGAYHRRQQVDAFFSLLCVGFVIRDTSSHYHVPLLLSPFAVSIYRGS
jgi:5-hydroxyisourate hydrolase